MPVYKFTPDLLNFEDLERLSVGREDLLSEILRRLTEHSKEKTPMCLLVVGARGIGKSHFLLRSYYRIRKDPQLSNLIHPIKLSEEEYSIHRIADLFQRVLEEENVRLPSAGDDESIIRQSIGHLRELKKTKMPLLIMDNIHIIFGQLGAKDLKRLRSILQEENFLMILGSAPSIFGEISDYNAPFYDFFEVRFLRDLSQEEIEELVRKKLEFEGKQDLVLEFKQLRPRIKAISVLTGGNPRLILMICDILCRPERLEDLEKSLFGLLDELTPFYQAKMESLPTQQRAIFDILALSGGPLSPTEIANMSRIDVNIVNVQIKRLEQAGYVGLLKISRKKGVNYEIRERLFRIWREMRSPLGRKRIQLFVRFLKTWYTTDELIESYRRLTPPIEKMQASMLHACYLEEAIGYPGKYREFLGRILELVEIGELGILEKEVNERKAMADAKKDKEKMTMALIAEALLLKAHADLAKARDAIEHALNINPDVAYTSIVRAWILAEMSDYEGALKSYDNGIRTSRAKIEKHDAYFEKALILSFMEKYKEALDSAEMAIETDPQCSMSWDLKSQILADMGKFQEALKHSEYALKMAPNKSLLWLSRAGIYLGMRDYVKSLESSEKGLKIEPQNEMLLDSKAHALSGMGKEREAIEVFRECFKIAKAKSNLYVATTCAIHIFGDFLVNSRDLVLKGDVENGQRLLKEALDLREYFGDRQECYHDIFLYYLTELSKKGSWTFIERAVNLVDKELGDEDKVLFVPFLKAIQYIKTKNTRVLESVQKEVRDIVVSIIKTLSPDTAIPNALA